MKRFTLSLIAFLLVGIFSNVTRAGNGTCRHEVPKTVVGCFDSNYTEVAFAQEAPVMDMASVYLVDALSFEAITVDVLLVEKPSITTHSGILETAYNKSITICKLLRLPDRCGTIKNDYSKHATTKNHSYLDCIRQC